MPTRARTLLTGAGAESADSEPKRRKKAATREPKKAAAQPKSPKKAAATLQPPAGWDKTYSLIEELRADRTAVVDKMGSEAIAAQASADDRAYQTLISLMLSSQTKDTVNMATMRKLREHGCNLDNILDRTTDDELRDLIYGVGFHNNKVKFIKATSALLREKHAGKVPDNMDALLELPGVGPKMAIILLRVVFGHVVGISVDTHVHRISNQLGWAGSKGTKQPEQTRAALESWMPRHIWQDVNLLLVGLGQEVQTEKPKLLRKALSCSDPPRALRLLATCGVNVSKELAKEGLEAP